LPLVLLQKSLKRDLNAISLAQLPLFMPILRASMLAFACLPTPDRNFQPGIRYYSPPADSPPLPVRNEGGFSGAVSGQEKKCAEQQ
jgi:hypothetical protein